MLHRGLPLLTKGTLVASLVIGLAACSQQIPVRYTKFEGRPPDATVEMHEVQAAYIGSAGEAAAPVYRGPAYPSRRRARRRGPRRVDDRRDR